ncbi:MAG TPA: anaerobic glycerol-3-phosphate dehydrogenase subunit GlpC [Spirochaetota bacterium]|nr:anaerobic glycerol-3-phosphate dehydrogenase subunit GlpC [Spirochaetota bacterium]
MINLENISFDHCIKCTVCTIYCPVARETHLFPGPKQSGPDTERLRIKDPYLVDDSLKYCSNCKRCEIACPSGVKIADLIQVAKFQHLKKKIRVRDFFMSRTDLVGRLATFMSFLTNFVINLLPVKFFMDVILKIPFGRSFPKYASGTFHGWAKKKMPDQSKFRTKAVYFHGCYVNYNNHQLGKDLVDVLNAMNIGVITENEKCCGVPLIANGYIDKAKKNAAHNIQALSRALGEEGTRIVSTSSSCSYALKYEYANLLELNNATIYDKVDYITKYLYSQFETGNIPPMKPVNLRAAYHSPCHLERMGGVIYTINVLKEIPGLDLVILHSECCGIAGTYGFKKEYYEISQSIGANLFRNIEKADVEVVITDCETCKMQIEMNTPYEVLHPVQVLARAIKNNTR